jgi:hypothetical protein
LLALIASAHAATPVVAEGDPEHALSAIESRTLVARENLALVDVSEILAPGPPEPIPCTGPPVTQQELRAELSAVLALYDAGDLIAAREKAASWTTGVACVTEVVDPDWLWSAGFVSGQLAWGDGDREGAKRAWTQARSVDPTRPWDDDFTPGDRALDTFATAFAGRDVPFQTLGGPFLVDGRPAEPTAPAGLHVIQTGSPVRTWLVDVRDPILAVHPATHSEHLSVDEWSVLLATRHPAEDRAYLVRRDTVIELDLRAHTSSEYPPPPMEDPPKKWGRWLAGAGLAVATAGLVDVLLFSRPAAVDAMDEQAYDAAVDRMIVDYVLMGTGAATMLVAAPNVVRTWETEPTPTP